MNGPVAKLLTLDVPQGSAVEFQLSIVAMIHAIDPLVTHCVLVDDPEASPG